MKFVLGPLALAVSAAVGWLVYQDSLQSLDQETAEPPRAPAAVHVATLQSRPIEERVDLVGSLQANAEVEIRTAVAGYVQRMPFDVQDHVEQGTLIVELDDSKYHEMVVGAEAALKVAQAQLKAKQANAVQAKEELERQVSLGRTGVATEQQQQAARALLEIAEAEVELEQARVAQAESELLRTKLVSNETRIEAPMTGLIAERYAEVGDLAGANIPLLRMVDIRVVKTVVHVIEKDYEKVQIRQRAGVEVDAFPGRTFEGKVLRKAPVLDPNTRTAAVHVEIPNPEGLLKPGMHARVSIVLQRREAAPVIPIAALMQSGERSEVYVVSGEPALAERREIETGIIDGEVVEVLSGLGPAELVITLGSSVIDPEQPLIAQPDPAWQRLAGSASEGVGNTGG